ncbi:MarR family transcriptional regulator [Novosphingobium jiangmenense]|uniref:MarR family transcriptional regulator n=1 Tax=Novosphingobium jiangmenense TaxID=2791981 RepID=A0ABS0HD33_9SPHN|nr:MarR family transcriptional regulator [Novosphingobium jiangmenense]MBF9150198.1 MarR family transcriptional regulator [Novosphingobium jiangmenense]
MGKEQMRARARRLIGVANELLALAHELEARECDGLQDEPVAVQLPKDNPSWADLARSAYRDRRRRSNIFGDPTLFGEPAWDILLDLFIAAKERKRLPVTSACIGAAVPATTALRWLTVLEEKGLIVRENDLSDARRVFVRLSSDGYEKMVSYFAEMAREQRNDDDLQFAALKAAL